MERKREAEEAGGGKDSNANAARIQRNLLSLRSGTAHLLSRKCKDLGRGLRSNLDINHLTRINAYHQLDFD